MLIAFILTLSAILLLRLACQRMYVSNPPPPRGERFEELASRIDPNIATWQELAVLPAIGEKRAKEIIAYREMFVARQPTAVAFARTEDLMRIPGIGPAMVETLRPHLLFPAATQPATQRAAMPSATTTPAAANRRSPDTYD